MLNRLAALWGAITRWYVSTLLLVGAGTVLGYVLFFNVASGKPQVGIIDVPFQTITDSSAFFFGMALDYAERKESIKAVVIKMDSPGGFAFASDQLFEKTLRLRGKKPIVIAVEGVAASGAYLWSMGANYIYTTPSAVVGSVGAFVFVPPSPEVPEEFIFSGPSKLTGGPYRTQVAALEVLKDAFVATVASQRGDKLELTPEELSEARVYPGMEAVRLGLVDAIGGDSDAIEKAADLANIAHYDLVDVNMEVLRQFVQSLRRIFNPEEMDRLLAQVDDGESLAKLIRSLQGGDVSDLGLPGVTDELIRPQLYYLYVPPAE